MLRHESLVHDITEGRMRGKAIRGRKRMHLLRNLMENRSYAEVKQEAQVKTEQAGELLLLWQPFYGPLSGTTRVSRYQKKISPTHHPVHHPIFISFFHLPRSSLFKLYAWQSFRTTSFHVLFGLPLGLEPSTSYSIYFFTQSVSSFRNTCPYHRNLFCCSTNIVSSIPSLSLNSLLGNLSFTWIHIHLR